ncbi:MAG: tRNA (adenosine(37)-N6)-threonylcarbamoyltransferase complex ATPase subunit type 1 TsaE [bacterium]
MSETFTTKSSEETVNLGKKLGQKLRGGEVIFLIGDLGGGKTQFAKGVALGLGIVETVVSPTFTIERIYTSPRHSREGGNLVMHHFDLYRLTNDREINEEIKEISESGVEIMLIEWPENLEGIQGLATTKIQFEHIDEDIRKITTEEIK